MRTMDYEVNLKAELEIMALHNKVDRLSEKQWGDLIAIQREQLSLLSQLIEGKMKSRSGPFYPVHMCLRA